MTEGEAYCRRLLLRAVESAGAASGAVFVVGPSGNLAALASIGRAEPADEAVLADLAEGFLDRDVILGAPDRRLAGGVALPVGLDGGIVAVVSLHWMHAADASPERASSSLEDVLLPIALCADRFRSEAALHERGAQLEALRRQLETYAVDVRSTYLAERQRSHELAAALAELEETYKATVRGLAIAVEAKDECTGGHLQRVTRYGMALTRLVAPEHAADPQFEFGFLLHDVGKLTVPDGILMNPGALSEGDWDVIRRHPGEGRSILAGIPFLAGAREIVYAHHERWDGRGYPRGLVGEEIPLGAQIFPVCDAFDAMTSDRPYRQALAVQRARDEIGRGRGTQFRPDVVDAFLSIPVDALQTIRDVRAVEPA